MINKNFAILMGVVALGIVVSAVMFRYEVKPSTMTAATYYKTDRWTGTTYTCAYAFETKDYECR